MGWRSGVAVAFMELSEFAQIRTSCAKRGSFNERGWNLKKIKKKRIDFQNVKQGKGSEGKD